MATYKDIKRQIADLEKKAAEARKVEVAKVIAAIQKQIEEYDLAPADLFKGAPKATGGKSAKKGPKAVNPPKYMDAKTGKTWTGFGKAPGWIADAVKKGKKEDFLIAKVEALRNGKAAAAVAAKKPVKATAKPAAAKPAAAKPAAAKPAVAKKAAAKPTKPAKPAAKPAPVAAPAPSEPAAEASAGTATA